MQGSGFSASSLERCRYAFRGHKGLLSSVPLVLNFAYL